MEIAYLTSKIIAKIEEAQNHDLDKPKGLCKRDWDKEQRKLLRVALRMTETAIRACLMESRKQKRKRDERKKKFSEGF